MSSHFDVVVVGAGPSGSLAAFKLKQLGFKVLLLEKKSLPRYKTCGGGVTHKAAALLPFPIHEVVERECFEAELGILDADLRFSVRREKPLVHMVMRDDFDFRLFEVARSAGVEVRTKCAVKNLERKGLSWKVQTDAGGFYTTCVVGADGAQGIVAKHGRFPDHELMAPALEYEVWVSEKDLKRFDEKLVIDFGIVPGGYAWVFPKKRHLSIGVGRVLPDKGDLNELYRAYMRYLNFSEILKEERHGFMVPVRPRKIFVKDGIFLIGDAAGFADPLTAEGIGSALESAQYLADAFREYDPRVNMELCERSYWTLINKNLLPHLKSMKVVAQCIYRFPRVRNYFFRKNGQRLTSAMCDVMAGTKPYPSLRGIGVRALRTSLAGCRT